jgi:hypothetical protein
MAQRAPILAASLIGLVIGVAAGCQTIEQPSPRSSSPPAASPSAVAVVPTPEPTQEIGPLVEGVPTTLDGEGVFTRDALRAEIRNRTDATPFYAGGWFREGMNEGRFCTLYAGPMKLFLCGNGFSLHDGRAGYWSTEVTYGWPRVIPLGEPVAADRAVVLRIHTHDTDCSQLSEGYDCAHIPVLESVGWLGDVQTAPPIPTERPAEPTDGLTRAEAIALGRAEVVGPEELLCARLLIYSEVEGALHSIREGYNDPWVWYLGFKRGFQSYAEVAYQYKTGRFLFSSAGHGPGAGPQHC